MDEIKSKKSLMIKDILAKKELSGLDEKFVLPKLDDVLTRYHKLAKKFESSEYENFRRSKEFKEIQQKVRSELRTVYGVFIKEKFDKRHELLEQLKKAKDNEKKEIIDQILSLHQSTKERLNPKDQYFEIYHEIFKITGKPKKILDLACGINPLSYLYLDCAPEYLACDLSQKDMDFINEFFKIMKIKGTTKQIDLMNDDVTKISNVDVVFLFKALDSLEFIEWNKSEEVLKKLKSKWVVVSFATRNIGQTKEIKKEKRAWFDRIIEREKWKSTIFEIDNEIFYVVKK